MLQYLKLFSQDITLTKALEESLKPYGVFESEEELQHRLVEYSILKLKEECALLRLLWLLWQVEKIYEQPHVRKNEPICQTVCIG